MVTATTRPPGRRMVALLGLLAALGLVAAACGPRAGDDASPGAVGAAVVREAAERTGEITSGRLRTTVTVEVLGESAAPTEVMVNDIVFDTEAERSSVTSTVDVAALGVITGQDVAGDGIEPGFEGLFDEPLTTVVDGGTVYSQWPAGLSGGDATGTVWVRVDDAFAGLLGAGAGPGGPAGFPEAERALESLEAVADPVVATGTEVVDGVSTTRYEGELDLDEAAELAGDEAPADLGTLRASYVVWIDGDGLLRRAEVVLAGLDRATVLDGADGADGDRELRMTTTMTFSDLGEPVTIEVPPADEVLTLADLFTGMADGGEFEEFAELFGELGESMTESTGP